MKDNLNFSPNQLSILEAKYLQKDEEGKIIESPGDLFTRVAKAVSLTETPKNRKKYQQLFYDMMANLEFLPGGRTLANAGTGNDQLANCFVLPFEDNIEEIFESVKDSAILKKNGGGVGFSFSKIRPKNDKIIGTSGKACGPIALMKVLDACSEIFLQDGKRRSGNMIVLSTSHPDIFDFITCKQNETSLNQVNFSLWVSDNFMKKAIKNKKWGLINPRTGRKVSTISAKSILELTATFAWKNGDPGLLFRDRINKDNPTPNQGPIEAVNLCGEQPLLSYEACNLGSINLVKFLAKNGRGNPSFDWDRLESVTRLAVRFLDNVIDVCKYPLAQVDRVVKENRKIGLGVMGWADSLVKMKIPYSSPKAQKLAGKLMKFINSASHEESVKLGKTRGSFPSFKNSTWAKKVKKMRNASTTTIAPTGSISMVAGASSGIEPLFGLSYYKEVLGGTRLQEINPDLIEALNILNPKNIDQIKTKIIQAGTLENIDEIPKDLKEIFTTAHDLNYQEHISMQAAFQKHTDNAVSKTINFPNNATVEDVQKAFLLAWKLKCKGITIYRDGSRQMQVLNIGDGKKQIGQICPVCKTKLIFTEGCNKCLKCGWGECSV